MNYLAVKLWGIEIGRLAYNPRVRQCYFTFNPDLRGDRPDLCPIAAPLHEWQKHQVLYANDQHIYHGLPPFIADSLPDAWGNIIFEEWSRRNKNPQLRHNPLYKLTFIGERGMGALEFEPASKDLEHPSVVDVSALYSLSLDILHERKDIVIKPDEQLTMQALLAVGTSAGGRNMKAIIAINEETGEIKSGQIDNPEGYDYYILKFENEYLPTTEIEMAFYDMATACGVKMETCRILEVDGKKHFLTKRFDRKNGGKIHVQTLAAMNPETQSYENLFETCRDLGLTQSEIEQLYRRMVFNVISNNTDDHNKNFSFTLENGGNWQLSPAYDITFIFNEYGTDGNADRCMAIRGKFSNISKNDIIEIGKENDIRDPEGIIDEVANSLSQFSQLADKYDIESRWKNIIAKTLNNNLANFGYGEKITLRK